jgi:hypothetical protein
MTSSPTISVSGLAPITPLDELVAGFTGASADALVDDFGGHVEDENAAIHINHENDHQRADNGAEHPETFLRTLLEVVFPFVMAGFGCMFAGVVLDIVQVRASVNLHLIGRINCHVSTGVCTTSCGK